MRNQACDATRGGAPVDDLFCKICGRSLGQEVFGAIFLVWVFISLAWNSRLIRSAYLAGIVLQPTPNKAFVGFPWVDAHSYPQKLWNQIYLI
jgi:hypothetical protein